jgi:ABC-2 type transport system ATP-binding protein
MSIELKNVSKLYGEQKAVNNIQLSISKGEIVGFLGPNGAGKSTSMKMITGFLSPTSGTIEVCGLNVAEHPLEIRKKIGYLPESNPQYYEMYVREYLLFLAQLHQLGAASKARVEEMIGITGLGREAHKKIGALSKGYKQRVGLAQAMIHNPEVLILDEPTSGLDPNQIVEIRDLISAFGKEKTVLLSTHIMQEVNAMCQRVIIINKGSIVADESIETIRNREGKNEEFIQLETASSIKLEAFLQLAKVIKVEAVSANKYLIATSHAQSSKQAILQYCMQQNIDIVSISSQQASLEEVFRQLTQ